jgi:predicted nucleic acid-binding protein
MSLLLDTNIIVDLLNGHQQTRAYLQTLKKINVSSITVYEVLAGCTGVRSGQLNVAEVLFSKCNVASVSQAISMRAAGYQRRWNQKRKMADFLIEATAEELGFELVTRNPKDFRQVKTVVPYSL